MENEKRISTIFEKPPTYASVPIKSGHSFLTAKRVDDDVEDGLWRIHDTLYDLTEFINSHPGGPDWLTLTKGTDITEAFEVHHLDPTKLNSYLKKFYVRPATTPQNSKLTFKPNGFYVTVRKRVAEKLRTIDVKTINFKSKLYVDTMFLAMVLLSIASVRFHSVMIALVTSLIYTWIVIAGHNFLHRRDNFRMIYFNMSFMSYRDWRMSHALSHHLFPNSLHDVEIMLFEPIICWLPNSKIKNWIQRYVSWVYSIAFYFVLYFAEFLKKLLLVCLRKCTLHLDELIPLALPLIMYLFGNDSIGTTLKYYGIILVGSSFYFSVVGLNAGHHHPEAVHDGDALRDGLDWGIYQFDTTIDRKDIRGNHFMVLGHFGDHGLHHLFPTLDHGILSQLYPILFETMHEFEVEFVSYPWWNLIKGQFEQLARNEPMKKSSYERSKYYKRSVEHKNGKSNKKD